MKSVLSSIVALLGWLVGLAFAFFWLFRWPTRAHTSAPPSNRNKQIKRKKAAEFSVERWPSFTITAFVEIGWFVHLHSLPSFMH